MKGNNRVCKLWGVRINRDKRERRQSSEVADKQGKNEDEDSRQDKDQNLA